jgi:hypothetical protein
VTVLYEILKFAKLYFKESSQDGVIDIITLPILLSLVFFTSFAIYLFMGIYIYFLNRHSAKNILFVLVCLALCVWTFSFQLLTQHLIMKLPCSGNGVGVWLGNDVCSTGTFRFAFNRK